MKYYVARFGQGSSELTLNFIRDDDPRYLAYIKKQPVQDLYREVKHPRPELFKPECFLWNRGNYSTVGNTHVTLLQRAVNSRNWSRK